MSDISKIDPNMRIETKINKPDIRFYDIKQKPFEVYGLYNYLNEDCYKRMPDDVAKSVSPSVATLSLQTAGGRIRFSTDSQYVAIKAVTPCISLINYMPLSGSSGFDIYVDDPETGDSRFRKTVAPKNLEQTEFEGEITFNTRQMRHYTVHFPSYNEVTAVYIGLQEDAAIGEGMKYRNDPPIVYYGSSITQGAFASRPGNSYENLISRRFGMDYINLGFAGNGKAEDTIVDYMAKLPMSIFVCDYDHNAPHAKYLSETHLKMYQKIRAAHPHIPYIMISKPDYDNMQDLDENIERRNVVFDTYRYAFDHGDRNVYYIDGASIFRGAYEDTCTVDRTHPNDLGFALMAEAIGAEIRRSFSQKKIYY